MLSKSEIIKELKNKEFIVRNAVYEYVCRLHLYDDEDINKAFIEFIENNYNKDINYVGLIHSKLNKEIIESLIKLHEKEDKLYIKSKIEDVLIHHYSYIKDMNYNFEELFADDYSLLMYRKIKHFTKKEPKELLDRYLSNINDLIDGEEGDYTKEKLTTAMGTALIQTEEGARLLTAFVLAQLGDKEYHEDFIEQYMPYIIYPLCEYSDELYNRVVQDVYYLYMDFIGYADDCNYYFSNICSDEFIDEYIDVLKRKDIEDYYYDICEYLNSEKIDLFLLEKLKSIKDKDIKENIIRILVSKFDTRVIPYAEKYLKNKSYDDEEELDFALAPLFIINNYDTDISKKVIKDVKGYLEADEHMKNELISNMVSGLQDLMLKNKPHIKEYKKVRKLYDEIIESFGKYYMQGRFEIKIENKGHSNEVVRIDTKFDPNTELGANALANVVVYKNAVNMSCITEDFIKNNHYRSADKKELLQSMLDSHAGLFEITKTDIKNGKVHLKDVLNENEFSMTDIGLSSNYNNNKIYLYTRLITYHDICFGTGLNIVFSKEDEFIKKWIEENKNNYNERQEIVRFIELYNEYIRDNKGNKIISKPVY